MQTLSDQDKIDIVNLYKSGIDSVKIGKLYDRSPPAIRNLLKRREVKINKNRVHNVKYTYNENYFETIDSEDKAYFLGLLYADGCNKTTKNTVTLFLNEGEEYLLEMLNKFISIDKPLSKEKGRGKRKLQYGIRLHNNKISKDLLNLGVFKAKTFILKFPTEEQVPSHLIHHFIRGYFDGDGHIGFSTNKKGYIKDKIDLTGTEDFLKEVETKFKNLGVHSSWHTRHPERNHNIRSITISGRNQVIKIMTYLYINCSVRMERKYIKFQEILNRKSWKERN